MQVRFLPEAHVNCMAEQEIIISEQAQGMRLDFFLVEHLGISRSQVQKKIAAGLVHLNGEIPKKNGQKLRLDDTILVFEKPEPTEKQEFPHVEIISETETYAVVNKPAGLLVHPTEANEPITLASWLRKHIPAVEGVGESDVRPGIVHRLDKDASGLLVVAKTQEMFEHLKAQFKARTVKKEYLVLSYGVMQNDQETIDFAIDRGNGGKMVARPHLDTLKLKNVGKEQEGKDALTEVVVEQRFSRFSFLKVRIHTGRMHQIRVHLFAFGHPVVGDTLYMKKKFIKRTEQPLGRLFLHAHALCVTDLDGQEVCFQSGLPDQLQNYLDMLQ